MEAPEDNETAIDNRRRAARRDSQANVHISLETGSFGGTAENISAAGVFFFSGDRLRVRIEVEENGRTAHYAGRIVRIEPMSESSSGFAIEFDRA